MRGIAQARILVVDDDPKNFRLAAAVLMAVQVGSVNRITPETAAYVANGDNN